MRIDIREARRIADLARIEFDDAGLERMARELSKILDYIDQLKSVPRPALSVPGPEEPDAGRGTGDAGPLREDEVRPSLSIEDVERNAPAFAHGFFIVPKVI